MDELMSAWPEASGTLVKYAELLLRRNEDMNLTGADSKEKIVSRHILDSLALARLLPETGTVVDVGSGAGFPGLPLAIALPGLTVTLLDAREKRVDFLREAAETLGVKNVRCVYGRAEELALEEPWRDCFDAALSRAVARMAMLTELCLPLVKPGGTFYAMKAAACGDEVAEAASAIEKLGGAPASLISYIAGGVERAIVAVDKRIPTPEGFPRRFSKIKKNAL